MGWQMPQFFLGIDRLLPQEAESQCWRCAQKEWYWFVRPQGRPMGQTRYISFHQFGFPGSFWCFVWCFLLPPADDFSQLRLPGALETPCKTSFRRSPRLKEMRERAAAAAPVTPKVVKVEVPQSLGQAVLALSGVELQAQLFVRDLMRTDVMRWTIIWLKQGAGNGGVVMCWSYFKYGETIRSTKFPWWNAGLNDKGSTYAHI